MIDLKKRSIVAISLVILMTASVCAGIIYASPEVAAKTPVPRTNYPFIYGQVQKIDTCYPNSGGLSPGAGLNYMESELIWDERVPGSDGSINWDNMGNANFMAQWTAPAWPTGATSQWMWENRPNDIYNSHRYANVGVYWQANPKSTCPSSQGTTYNHHIQWGISGSYRLTVTPQAGSVGNWNGDSVTEIDLYAKFYENSAPGENKWISQPLLKMHMRGGTLTGVDTGVTPFTGAGSTDLFTGDLLTVANTGGIPGSGEPVFAQFYVDAYHNNVPVDVKLDIDITSINYQILDAAV